MANSQIAYINQTIEIPHVTEQDSPPEYIGQGSRTATGRFRYDAIAMKKSYTLKATYLTPSEFNAIESYLFSIKGGITDFWIDEFGGDSSTHSVRAQIILKDVERVQFSRDGVWYNNGKTIELEVIIV